MRFIVVLAAALLCASNALSQNVPINELPMYGGIAKSPAMIEADNQLIRSVLAGGFTREQGSARAARLGWEARSNGDLSTAMKRFNQAWLLDPQNYESYWGFAILLATKEKYLEAGRFFELALEHNGSSPQLFADFARLLNTGGLYREAIEIAKRALVSDPNFVPAHLQLALAYLRTNQIGEACHSAHILEAEKSPDLPASFAPSVCAAAFQEGAK